MAMPPYVPKNPLEVLDIENLMLMGLEMIPGSDEFFNRGYSFSSLKYPDDIEHYFMHGHYINFFVNVQRASHYLKGESYQYNGGQATEIFGISTGIPGTATFSTTDTGYFGEDLTLVGNTQSKLQKLTTQRITQAISLYVPDSMSFTTNIGWDEVSLTGKGKELLETAAKSIADKFGAGGLVKSLLTLGEHVGQAAGFALNPELLVLFRGIDRRRFQYDFFFSPKSEREAYAVKNIIKAFRFHAAPEINKDYGVFFVAPSTFDIEFMHRGVRNTNIHQVKTCVLTNYSVDYAPYGWSTHTDGMPVQTRLSLTFEETQLLTKEDVEKGF
jgi:hypothetical protein